MSNLTFRAAYPGIPWKIAFDIVIHVIQIVFDECHKAKSPTSNNGRKVNEIQLMYPKARIVYVSATASSDIDCMHYMSRLGLWGPEMPVKDFSSFKRLVGVG